MGVSAWPTVICSIFIKQKFHAPHAEQLESVSCGQILQTKDRGFPSGPLAKIPHFPVPGAGAGSLVKKLGAGSGGSGGAAE